MEFKDAETEISCVATWIEKLAAEGIPPSDVAVLVRSHAEMPRAERVRDLLEMGSAVRDGRTDVRVMHDAKGAEYRAVAVMACDEDVLPKEDRLVEDKDAAMIEEVTRAEFSTTRSTGY
jgi:superfamily I DNA/RNA helicase